MIVFFAFQIKPSKIFFTFIRAFECWRTATKYKRDLIGSILFQLLSSFLQWIANHISVENIGWWKQLKAEKLFFKHENFNSYEMWKYICTWLISNSMNVFYRWILINENVQMIKWLSSRFHDSSRSFSFFLIQLLLQCQ